MTIRFRKACFEPSNSEYPAFENITHARAWVERFVRWYNHEHRHSANTARVIAGRSGRYYNADMRSMPGEVTLSAGVVRRETGHLQVRHP